jgi:hypothetical protein
MKKFIAVQLGARHSYAVPSILEKGELLETFYTDLCADVGAGKYISSFCPLFLKQRGLIRNFCSRRLPANIIRLM